MPINNSNKKELVCITNYGPIYKTEFEENKFPLEVFPQALTDLIRELHVKSGFPVEFSAGSLLAAVATAIGATIKLNYINDFSVTANLFLVICGDPGTCKTHPFRFMFKPIEKRKAKYFIEYKKRMIEYNEYKELSKKEKEEREPVTKPTLRIDTVDDFTLESFIKDLSENPRGISVIVDEINGFIKNMNRYNSGSDGETYNTLWTSGPLSKKRVSAEPLYVHPTAVSIFGTVQPDVLYNLFAKDNGKNGLTARFLFIMPSNLLPIKWGDTKINEDLIDQYHQIIEKLLDIELKFNDDGEPAPTILKFTEEAFNRMTEWRNGDFRNNLIEEKGNTYCDAFSKLDIYTMRFALLLHVMYALVDKEPFDKVGIRAVENAILLCNYFKKEVIKINNFIHKKDIRLGMSKIQREVYEILTPEFYLSQSYDKVAKLGFTKDQLKKFAGISRYFTRTGYGKYSKNFSEYSDD